MIWLVFNLSCLLSIPSPTTRQLPPCSCSTEHVTLVSWPLHAVSSAWLYLPSSTTFFTRPTPACSLAFLWMLPPLATLSWFLKPRSPSHKHLRLLLYAVLALTCFTSLLPPGAGPSNRYIQ